MSQGRALIVAWVVREILPHEAVVRAWLRRSRLSAEDIEDVIQDAYCRFSGLETVSEIRNPRGYFVRTVRGLVIDRIRRSKVVSIDTVSDLVWLEMESLEPGPDREAFARQRLAYVQRLIASLPARCRTVFTLRKIEGVPQREIAARLGIPETVVENDVMRGQRFLSRALADVEGDASGEPIAIKGPARA